MPIFISYSQRDSEFVDRLAANLVLAKHHIWMDRWELNVGDSITAKIQESLTDSSAILVILSKNSVDSQWCKRELTAGLVREMEERKTLVMPIVIDDCEIPLFMRDKLYADFRKDPDAAFNLVDRALSKISNPTTSRSESPDFHTDFAVEWKQQDDDWHEESWIVRWTFVDHGPNLPYVVLSECKIYAAEGEEIYEAALKAKNPMKFIRRVMDKIGEYLDEEPLAPGLITNNLTQFVAWRIQLSEKEKYVIVYSYRRLGIDSGMDTIVHLENNIRMALKHLRATKPV